MPTNGALNRKLRMGLIGGGQGAFIGRVHATAAVMDNRAALVAGALSSDWPAPGSRFRPVADDTFFLETDPEFTLSFKDLAGGAYQRLVIEGYAEPASGARAAEAAAETVA